MHMACSIRLYRLGPGPGWARRCATFVPTSSRSSTMAAAAAASAASGDGDASTTCFICLEPHSASQYRLLHGGCGCRGGSGFAHLACIAKAAQTMNARMWQECPTCKQEWTGQMELGLTRARVASLASRPEGDWERLNAGS